MTQFGRRSYLRTSKYGIRHWVAAATVCRDDWHRISTSRVVYGSANTNVVRPQSFLERHPEFQRMHRVSACFVDPNARCPVCDEPVFYYENEWGSRVFFDELMPPWPKHPFTNSIPLKLSLFAFGQQPGSGDVRAGVAAGRRTLLGAAWVFPVAAQLSMSCDVNQCIC